MDSRRWLNQGQPQTLVIACFLLYINAAFALLAVLAGAAILSGGFALIYYGVTIGGGIGGGYGIANERRWGYILGLVTAFLPFALSFAQGGNPFADNLINLIFEIALVALLLHTQSRDYQRIYFK